MKRWATIFRALANINRLLIVKMLLGGKRMNVTDIARELDISLTSTSNHLALLKNLDVLEARGTEGHVYYFLSPDLPEDFRKIIDAAFLRK